MDIFSKSVRRRVMQAVGRQDTPLEQAVRKALFEQGCRFRTNVRALPGTPDVANRTKKWAVFVHGCFWHGHRRCRKTKGGPRGRVPETNRDWWQKKLIANRRRDLRNVKKLRSLGYSVLVIWECQVMRQSTLHGIVSRFIQRVYH
jgi:DNA mismatch endonuclease (patch repair protein)